jgi:hypothetical protein
MRRVMRGTMRSEVSSAQAEEVLIVLRLTPKKSRWFFG